MAPPRVERRATPRPPVPLRRAVVTADGAAQLADQRGLVFDRLTPDRIRVMWPNEYDAQIERRVATADLRPRDREAVSEALGAARRRPHDASPLHPIRDAMRAARRRWRR